MSYIVSIIRPITKSDLLTAIDGDDEFSILSEGDNYVDFTWTDGVDITNFVLERGEISVTTPSSRAWEKMNQLATHLGATVIGEEDSLPVRKELKQGIFDNRVTWVGWPILVLVLLILVIWKW